MDNLRKAILVKGSSVIGAVGDKYFSSTPIGVIQAFSGNTIPRGFLLCDGASYKVADYPHLYAVIGNTYGGDSTNFNVPDYRETVLVGVGVNTTDIDAIASHDVYGLGEFKDDQFQGHWHNLGNSNGTVTVALGASIKGGSVTGANPTGENRYTVENALDAITNGTNGEPRVGATTHGKQKGVTYIIKAFHTNEGVDSGVSDDVIDYVDGEIATKLDKEYITGITDANNAIGENGVNIFVMSASSANLPLSRTGVIRSYTTIENKYIRVNQEYSTIDNSPQNGGTYKRYGSSDDGGATFTWSNWNFVGSIDDSTTALLKTWSSSKIAQQDGVKSIFYASATAYPSILWVLSDVTTGVFWFKHTLSDSSGVKSVEGYADLTHDVARLISGSGSDIAVSVGTDTTSGKKGVRLTVAWGDNSTTSCKITEARPVTAIPTQVVSR